MNSTNANRNTVESNKKAQPPATINHLLKPIRKRLLLAATLAALGSMLALLPLLGIVDIVKLSLQSSHDNQLLTTWLADDKTSIIVISLCSLSLGLLLIFIAELMSHLADNQLTYQLRTSIAQRLAQVPLGWFTNKAVGGVKQAMQDDIATLHSLIAHFYTAVGRALGAVAISAVYLFSVDWRIALLTLLPFVGFFLFLRHAMQLSKANIEEFVARLGEINAAAVEFVSGMPVIKAFAEDGKADNGYRGAVERFTDAFINFTKPLIAPMAHAHALISPITILTLVLAVGALFIAASWATPLDVFAFLLVAPGICAPLLLLHTLLHDLGSANGAAQRVSTLLQTPTLKRTVSEPSQTPLSNRIAFAQVSYGYDPEHPVVNNINLTLEPGTVTAIVGCSGAGKSTLARLLLRFFDPDNGAITLGGVNLKELDITTLYQRIGFVLQEVRLIHASIRDNIALGRPSASQHEVEEAARMANIHDHILSLKHGYDTVVGRDVELSGGEQQRISIARAVLLDPPILVLDEATAAADADNEVAIQTALSRFTQARTLLVIAHRLDTVVKADHIIFMENGTIAEQGTHEQLLALGGRYARLWQLSENSLADVKEQASC